MTLVPYFLQGILYCYDHKFVRGNHSFSIHLWVAIKENFETNFPVYSEWKNHALMMSSGLSNWVTIFPIDAFELPVLLKRNYFQMPSGLVRDMADFFFFFLRVSEISIYNFTIICFMHLLMGWWYVGVFIGDHEDVRTLERVFLFLCLICLAVCKISSEVTRFLK